MTIPGLPDNLEFGLVGTLLLYPEIIDETEGLINAEDFNLLPARIVYETMLELYRRGSPCDMLAVKTKLKELNRLDDVGGVSFLLDLSSQGTVCSHLPWYCEKISQAGIKRRLYGACQDIISRIENDGHDVPKLIEDVQSKILDITDTHHKKEPNRIGSTLHQWWGEFEEFQQRHDKDHATTGYATGYFDLDSMTDGLHKQELTIIAGRPSMGKTTLALNIGLRLAESGVGVGIFSLEMGESNLARNLLGIKSRLRGQDLRKYRVSGDDLTKAITASDELGKCDLWIDDTGGISIHELRSKSRKLVRKGAKVILVDYLQLVSAGSSGNRGRNREQEVSEVSRGLKLIAKELEVPVIALSQLNRTPTGRKDPRPVLSDLRESGAIEQDADVVMMLHRPAYYEPNKPELEGVAEVIIGKQRNGPCGVVQLVFRDNQLRFENQTIKQQDSGWFDKQVKD